MMINWNNNIIINWNNKTMINWNNNIIINWNNNYQKILKFWRLFKIQLKIFLNKNKNSVKIALLLSSILNTFLCQNQISNDIFKFNWCLDFERVFCNVLCADTLYLSMFICPS